MDFRSPYNFDTDVSSFSSGISINSDEDMAQQSFKEECDINTLVKVYARTGVVPGSDFPSFNFEVDEIIDYQTALNRVMQADAAFMDLPSGLRERFQNDPGQLLAFIHDEANRDEAVELGLISKPGEPEPLLVRLSDAVGSVNTGLPGQAAPPSVS